MAALEGLLYAAGDEEPRSFAEFDRYRASLAGEAGRPQADLTSARLWRGGGRPCFEVRFRGAVPAEVGAGFELRQGGRTIGWTVELAGGTACGRRDGGGEYGRPLPVRTSVTGRTLRVSVRARDLRIRPGRPLRWTAKSFLRTTDGRGQDAVPKRGRGIPRPR